MALRPTRRSVVNLFSTSMKCVFSPSQDVLSQAIGRSSIKSCVTLDIEGHTEAFGDRPVRCASFSSLYLHASQPELIASRHASSQLDLLYAEFCYHQ